MTSAWECADTRQALGIYVLGAIDPDERALVDAHVAGCRECREELAGLAGLPALLSRVDADEIGRIFLADADPEADRYTGPDADLGTGPDADPGTGPGRPDVGRRPRRRTAGGARGAPGGLRRFAGLADRGPAAPEPALAGAGGRGRGGHRGGRGCGWLPAGERLARWCQRRAGPPASWQTAKTTSTQKGIDATIKYVRLSWGVAYDVQITGIPAGTTCQLWVTDGQGVHLLAAGWTVSSRDPDPWYPGSSWVPAGQVKGMDVTAGNEQLATFRTS